MLMEVFGVAGSSETTMTNAVRVSSSIGVKPTSMPTCIPAMMVYGGEASRVKAPESSARMMPDGERVGLCVGAGIQQEDGGFLGCSVARVEHDSAGRDLQLAAVIDAAVCIRIGIRVCVSVSVSVSVSVCVRIRIGIRSRTTGVHGGIRFVGSSPRGAGG